MVSRMDVNEFCNGRYDSRNDNLNDKGHAKYGTYFITLLGYYVIGINSGGTLAIPVNWWMAKSKMKHGMGTERVLGKGGAKFSTSMEMEGMDMKDMDKHSGHVVNMKSSADNKEAKNMKSNVSIRTKLFVAILSIIILAIGIAVAGYWGDFSMKPRVEMNRMQMK